MTKEEAIKFLKEEMVARVGGGYHPDNLMSDYVVSGQHSDYSDQFFTDEECDRLQPLHDEMLDVLSHDEIYNILLGTKE